MKHYSETQQCIIYLSADSHPWLFSITKIATERDGKDSAMDL